VPASGFGWGFARLVPALSADITWVRRHTRFTQYASEWESGGRRSHKLLLADDLEEAKKWLQQTPALGPSVTILQREYIDASEQYQSSRAATITRQRSVHASYLSIRFYLNIVSVWASMSSMSEIVNRWTDVKVLGIRQLSLAIYRYAREAVTAPLDFIAINIGFHIPPVAKDILIIYGIPAVGSMLHDRGMRRDDLMKYREDQQSFEEMIRSSAKSSGRDPDALWRQVHRGLNDRRYFYLRTWRRATMWPLTFYRNFINMFARDLAVRSNARRSFPRLALFTAIPIGLTILFFSPEAIRAVLTKIHDSATSSSSILGSR
jgi:hypothetical protein